jgi:DNA-directed RNA polymerase specialized sigma24 family protein
MHVGQTGGQKKTWLFDPSTVEHVGVLRDALIHHDEYFFEDEGTPTLGMVMDRILDELPEDISESVRLVHLEGRSLRAAGRILNIDHKTVKSRVDKGVEAMRKRLTDSVWIAEMLRGYLPAEEVKQQPLDVQTNVAEVIKSLKKESNEQK